MIVRLAIAIVLGVISTTSAQAEQTQDVNGLIAAGKKNKWIVHLVGAAGEAFSWSNTFLRDRGDEPLYCEPSSITIVDEQYYSILEGFVNRNPKFGHETLKAYPGILLLALQETFPCKE